MAKRTYRINAMVGELDASLDRPAIHNRHGKVIRHATKGTRFISAGDPVELDEAVGDALVAKHGGSVEPKTETASKPVKPSKAKAAETVEADEK